MRREMRKIKHVDTNVCGKTPLLFPTHLHYPFLFSRIAWLFGCSSKQPVFSNKDTRYTLSLFYTLSNMDYHNHEQQHDTPLIFNITTVDYNRKDPVFWIEAIVSRCFFLLNGKLSDRIVDPESIDHLNQVQAQDTTHSSILQ